MCFLKQFFKTVLIFSLFSTSLLEQSLAESEMIGSKSVRPISAKAAFSQLGFDAAVKHKSKKPAAASVGQLSLEELRSILGMKGQDSSASAKSDSVEAKSVTPVTAKKENSKVSPVTQARGRIGKLTQSWERDIPAEEAQIIPALKKAEPNNSVSALTSEGNWKPLKGASCGEPANLAALCDKSKALKEVLNRYTGSNDFFDIQCPFTCSKKSEVATLAGLRISGTEAVEFKMQSSAGQCEYQLSKGVSDKWTLLKASRATCVCLLESCK